ncbi:MAG: DUF1579 domain-containing protein [Gemmatimonadetes bacterium]|nr:DUF1579 domain-containing protein [Gemmatimonadota bacterium]
MRVIRRAALAAILPGLLAAPASAQAPQQGPQDCSAPEHRQFDFWLGEWNVTNPAGQPAGRNRITSILKNCVLLEEWTGAGGSSGRSYNVWSRADRRWYQTWVDDRGDLLMLTGGSRDGAMVLEGSTPAQGGGTTLHRVTWSLIDGDPRRVRQLWEQSRDNGTTWTIAFDGTYTRRS